MGAIGYIGNSKYSRIKKIFKSISAGSSIAAACKAADINIVTLWKWRQKDIELDKAIHKLIDSRVQMVEDALFKAAMDGNVKAIETFLFNRAYNRWTNKSTIINNVINNKVENKTVEQLPQEELDGILSRFAKRG